MKLSVSITGPGSCVTQPQCLGPLNNVRVFRRVVRLAAHGAGRVGRVTTAPVPTAQRDEGDGRVEVTAARTGRTLASLPVP